MPHRERLGWAVLAVAATVGLVLAALLTLRTGVGAAGDAALRGWLLDTLPGSLRQGLDRVARPLVIVALAPTVLVLALRALAGRDWRRAAAGLVIPAAATLLTLAMRATDAFGTGGDAFPSNHAAAGLGLLVGLAVVWPRPVTRKGLLALAVAAVGVGLGNVTGYAHQPRDVAGSVLVVAAVAAATFAVLGGDSPNLARAERPRRPDVRRTPSATPARAPRRSPPR